MATTRDTDGNPAPDAGAGAKKPGAPAPGGMRPQPLWVVVLLVVGANYLLMRTCAPESHSATSPYTVFKQQVEADNVVSVTGDAGTIGHTYGLAVSPTPVTLTTLSASTCCLNTV